MLQHIISVTVCANQMANIESPANGFKIECSAPESCTGSRFHLLYPKEPAGMQSSEMSVDLIKIAKGALQGSVITIDNRQSSKVYVNLVECGAGFCDGAVCSFCECSI